MGGKKDRWISRTTGNEIKWSIKKKFKGENIKSEYKCIRGGSESLTCI